MNHYFEHAFGYSLMCCNWFSWQETDAGGIVPIFSSPLFWMIKEEQYSDEQSGLWQRVERYVIIIVVVSINNYVTKSTLVSNNLLQ